LLSVLNTNELKKTKEELDKLKAENAELKLRI